MTLIKLFAAIAVFLCAIFISVFSLTTHAADNLLVASSLPKLIYVPSENAAANSGTRILVQGVLPGTCYKLGKPEVNVDEAKKRIVVNNRVQHIRRRDCSPGFVGYTARIDLGVLLKGSYDLLFQGEDMALHKMAIVTSP